MDALGRTVAVFFDGPRPASTSCRFDASALSPGVYPLCFAAGDATHTGRQTVVRERRARG